MEKNNFFSTKLFAHFIWLMLIGGSALFWWASNEHLKHKNELAVFRMEKVLEQQKYYFQEELTSERTLAYRTHLELLQTAKHSIDSFQTKLALFEKGSPNTSVSDLILLWDSLVRNVSQTCPESDKNMLLKNINWGFPTTNKLIELSKKNDVCQNSLLLKNLKFRLVNIYSNLLKHHFVHCDDFPTGICLSAYFNWKDPKCIDLCPTQYRTFAELATPPIVIINGDTTVVKDGLAKKQFICKKRGEIPIDLIWHVSNRCYSEGNYASYSKLFGIRVE